MEAIRLRRLYDGEVRFADEQFGRFLDLLRWLDLYENSAIVLVGDHGEEFAEHGGFGHGSTLADEVLRVPLIVRYPDGRAAGQRVDAEVSLVDVVPTILAALGLRSEKALDGVLLPVPGDRLARRAIYAEVAPFHDEEVPGIDLQTLIVGRTKCVRSRSPTDRWGMMTPELSRYDLVEDAGELLPETQADRLAECRGWFASWDLARRSLATERSQRSVAGEAMMQLRAVGYVK